MASFRFNIPDFTKVLLLIDIAICVLYTLARLRTGSNEGGTHASDVPYLALVPAKVVYYPWTLLSTTFVEQNLFNFLINVATVLFGGRYFERAWGSRGFAMTVLVTSLIPNILIVPIYWAWGAIMGNPDRQLTPCTGSITLQAAFIVAFKQLVPEHTISIYKGMVKFRVKHFPAIFLLLNTISGLVLGTDTALVFAWLGFLTSWIYLRFYKKQPDLTGASTNMRGDASETFAFATFFPNVMQPPITALADKIFEIMCAIKLCTPFSDEAIELSNQHAANRGDAGLPTFVRQPRAGMGMSKREEAERRRALALRALDQRLNAAPNQAKPPVSVTPSLAAGADQQALGQTDYKPDDH
jgi:membrane associated rhomboid family serine protease